MNIRRNLFNILAALFLTLLCATPALAQEADATPEPTPVIEVEPAPVTMPDATITLNIWQLFGGFIAAFSVGGIGGFAGAGLLATRLRNDPATMKAIEGLANSTPKHVTDALTAVGKSAVSVGELLIEASDGVPASTKAAIEQSQIETLEAVQRAFNSSAVKRE